MQPRLPLNSLNAFVSAAEFLSFQEAAKRLFVSSSAVSHQIRNLEKLLGYQLFERLDKRVRLTSRGEKLFADIRAPMGQLHEASRKALRGLEDNTLSLSVAPAFATGWLLPRLKDFYATYPEISLTVIASTDLVDFASDPFDASIRIGKGSWEHVTSVALFRMQLVAVCHPERVIQNKGFFSQQQLRDFPLIENSAMPGFWEHWFQRQPGGSSGLEYHLIVQNLAQVVEAVIQSGDAIGLVDRRFIRKDIDSGRLAIACDHFPESEDGYFLTYPDSGESLPSLRAFRRWILSQLDKSYR